VTTIRQHCTADKGADMSELRSCSKCIGGSRSRLCQGPHVHFIRSCTAWMVYNIFRNILK